MNRFDAAEQDVKDQIHEILKAKCEVDHQTGCWIWTGAWEANGQGKVRVGRRVYGVQKVSAWLYVSGFELWDDTRVAHSCDNPACFNPRHLKVLSSQAEALAYQTARGRLGAQHRKLTREKAAFIRVEGRTRSAEDLAAELGVSAQAVRNVLLGRTWVVKGGGDGGCRGQPGVGGEGHDGGGGRHADEG